VFADTATTGRSRDDTWMRCAAGRERCGCVMAGRQHRHADEANKPREVPGELAPVCRCRVIKDALPLLRPVHPCWLCAQTEAESSNRTLRFVARAWTGQCL
jgi:hypothetical protein